MRNLPDDKPLDQSAPKQRSKRDQAATMNVVRINLPMRPPIPDEDRRATAVAVIREWVKTQSEAVHSWALRIGETLIQLRALCHEDGKLWKSQFPATRAERDVETKLPFSYSTANKLISVYENEALRKVSHVLPADWGSLYQLSRIPAPRLPAICTNQRGGGGTERSLKVQIGVSGNVHRAGDPSLCELSSTRC